MSELPKVILGNLAIKAGCRNLLTLRPGKGPLVETYPMVGDTYPESVQCGRLLLLGEIAEDRDRGELRESLRKMSPTLEWMAACFQGLRVHQGRQVGVWSPEVEHVLGAFQDSLEESVAHHWKAADWMDEEEALESASEAHSLEEWALEEKDFARESDVILGYDDVLAFIRGLLQRRLDGIAGPVVVEQAGTRFVAPRDAWEGSQDCQILHGATIEDLRVYGSR